MFRAIVSRSSTLDWTRRWRANDPRLRTAGVKAMESAMEREVVRRIAMALPEFGAVGNCKGGLNHHELPQAAIPVIMPRGSRLDSWKAGDCRLEEESISRAIREKKVAIQFPFPIPIPIPIPTPVIPVIMPCGSRLESWKGGDSRTSAHGVVSVSSWRARAVGIPSRTTTALDSSRRLNCPPPLCVPRGFLTGIEKRVEWMVACPKTTGPRASSHISARGTASELQANPVEVFSALDVACMTAGSRLREKRSVESTGGAGIGTGKVEMCGGEGGVHVRVGVGMGSRRDGRMCGGEEVVGMMTTATMKASRSFSTASLVPPPLTDPDSLRSLRGATVEGRPPALHRLLMLLQEEERKRGRRGEGGGDERGWPGRVVLTEGVGIGGEGGTIEGRGGGAVPMQAGWMDVISTLLVIMGSAGVGWLAAPPLGSYFPVVDGEDEWTSEDDKDDADDICNKGILSASYEAGHCSDPCHQHTGVRGCSELLLSDSFRQRVFFVYERKIRAFSPLEKIFDYFASAETDSGVRVMSAGDLMRAVVPVLPPWASGAIREGKLDGEPSPGHLHGNQSELLMLFDVDKDGFVSFPEFTFFLSLLSVPDKKIVGVFNQFDLDKDGAIDQGEFMKVMERVWELTRYKASERFQMRKRIEIKDPKHAPQSILDYFFGKDGDKRLHLMEFANFLDEMKTELVRLEFAHYDFHNEGSILGIDFARSMVASADLQSVPDLLTKAESLLVVNPELAKAKISFPEFLDFVRMRRNWKKLADALTNFEDGVDASREGLPQKAANGEQMKSEGVSQKAPELEVSALEPLSQQLSRKPRYCMTPDRFKALVKEVCEVELSESQLKLVFHIFDLNGDGNLSCLEFLTMLHSREAVPTPCAVPPQLLELEKALEKALETSSEP
ncbi:hypothetical protein CBR_g4372 [Chara braunii]|uniref:EF-hand domain-containing protein n=1 Tax=Chara braunii TaxID=69332 RepID=A0A388KHQ5_CHABU|nr:hypothetical protein CBR_g4372 [Chara braunii]|eukprot:GBG69537.1 hypothetical protein CBR_g4372 [Chara braunii]